MAKVTSKLQLTIPKAIAEQCGIRPGSHIDLVAAGEVVRMVRGESRKSAWDTRERLRLFDLATERQRRRRAKLPKVKPGARHGLAREDLCTRGLAR